MKEKCQVKNDILCVHREVEGGAATWMHACATGQSLMWISESKTGT